MPKHQSGCKGNGKAERFNLRNIVIKEKLLKYYSSHLRHKQPLPLLDNYKAVGLLFDNILRLETLLLEVIKCDFEPFGAAE